jgi:hypothetical protein
VTVDPCTFVHIVSYATKGCEIGDLVCADSRAFQKFDGLLLSVLEAFGTESWGKR